MKIIYHLWATTGTYKDRSTGKSAKRQAQVGVVFQSEGGSLSMRMDTIPVSPEWNGFLAFRKPSAGTVTEPTPPEP